MLKNNQNDTLRKALNKARMFNRRKNLSEEDKQEERKRNWINKQEYRAQLAEEDKQEERKRNRINMEKY